MVSEVRLFDVLDDEVRASCGRWLTMLFGLQVVSISDGEVVASNGILWGD